MSEEKRRNILVSSDEVECNMTIRIPGDTITMLARQFWMQGSYMRAIQFLMEGVKNIPWHIAIGVLEGRLKFVGDPKITVEPDSAQGLPTYADAIKASEVRRDDQSVMDIETYNRLREAEEREKLDALKNEMNNARILPKPKKMLGKSFQELKEESGYADPDIDDFLGHT